jgi:hypothetical protein
MNYIEVGETAVSLARRLAPGMTESAIAALSREGTSLLERSGFLSRLDSNHAVARWLTDTAKEAMPAIQSAVGDAPHAGGDLLVVGKPFNSVVGAEVVPHANSLTIYEPHQNIAIHPDGQFRIDYPTPSGQRIRSDHYLPDGRWTGNTYSSSTADGYGFMPASEGVSATVASQFGSRQLMLNSAWDASRSNFTVNPVIDKFIRESRPVSRTMARIIEDAMGRTVSTPLADGKLVGFDRISGEALVTQHGSHPPGLSFDVSDASRRIGQNYPVKLTYARDAEITVQRTPTGKIQPFQLKSSDPEYKPNSTVFAFSPLEVKLDGRPLSEILGVEKSTGLRAMGGYSTVDGARIPIFAPDVSYAPRLAPEAAPRAYMDAIPRERSESQLRSIDEAGAAKRREEAAAKLRLEVEQKERSLANQRLALEHLRIHEETIRAAERARYRSEAVRAELEKSEELRAKALRPDPISRPERLHSSPIDRSYSPFDRSF